MISRARELDARAVAGSAGRASRALPTSWWAYSSFHVAAVRRDERVLGRDPVGLGVDERAVHVPQDGCGQSGVTSVLRVVAEVGREPPLGLGEGPALAVGVVLRPGRGRAGRRRSTATAGGEKYQPQTDAPGHIAMLSVSSMPVLASTSSSSQRVCFSVCSGQAG